MRETNKLPTQSTFLIHPIAIAVWLLFCVCSAFFGRAELSLFFGFIFAFASCSFIWGRLSLRNLEYDVSVPKTGVFPEQEITVTRKLYNGKLLPLIWLELLEPCDPNGCVAPGEEFITENPYVQEGESEGKYHALYSFGLLKWRQTLKFSDTWRARRRGIHRIDRVALRSGDGFGLCARNKRIALEPAGRIAVYPALVDVSVEKILNDMWDTRSASNGYLEDITLIKNIRGYTPSDPAKRINQRLLARGQGLNINLYEVVEPNSVLFVLDAASFQKSDPDDLELTLSVIASLIVALSERGVQAGLAVPASDYFGQTCVEPSCGDTSLARMLELLAAAGLNDPPLEWLDYPAPELIGQTYYIVHSPESATSLKVLAPFPEHKTQFLAFETGTVTTHGTDLRVREIKNFRRAI